MNDDAAQIQRMQSFDDSSFVRQAPPALANNQDQQRKKSALKDFGVRAKRDLKVTLGDIQEEGQTKNALLETSLEQGFLLSEGDEEVRKVQMTRMSKRRFGHNIKFDKYKTSNIIKIICIILAIIVIPLEIFLESTLQTKEDGIIQNLQKSMVGRPGLQAFFTIPLYLLSVDATCLFMFIFFLGTDSLIAFKSSILTCFGIYTMTFLKLLYKDGRPFWMSDPITGYVCLFDFAGPGYHLFILSFYWVYNLIMQCMKYSEKLNKPLIAVYSFLILLVGIWTLLAGLYTGTIYMYQNVIGILYGVIFLVICLNFDTEIHRMCEKTGFIVQSSRKYKFYLFFLCIGLFVAALIYYNSEVDYWTMPQMWVVNASGSDEACKVTLLQNSNNRLGLDQTFQDTSILFFLTSMGFGTSYSLVYVDCLDWVHTDLLRRAIRTVVGSGIAVGFYFALQQVPANDNPTKYFFHFVLPALILPFFVFGLFPRLCQLVGLVKPKALNGDSKAAKKDKVDEQIKKTDVQQDERKISVEAKDSSPLLERDDEQ